MWSWDRLILSKFRIIINTSLIFQFWFQLSFQINFCTNIYLRFFIGLIFSLLLLLQKNFEKLIEVTLISCDSILVFLIVSSESDSWRGIIIPWNKLTIFWNEPATFYGLVSNLTDRSNFKPYHFEVIAYCLFKFSPFGFEINVVFSIGVQMINFVKQIFYLSLVISNLSLNWLLGRFFVQRISSYYLAKLSFW